MSGQDIHNLEAQPIRLTPQASSLTPALLTAAAAGLLYLGFLSSRYNFDGTVFAFWLGQADHTGELGKLWHPRHLLYGPLSYSIYQILQIVVLKPSPILTLQIMDTLLAVACLVIFQILCLRLTKDKIVSITVTLLLGLSYGFWYFAIEPEMHALNTLLVTLSLFMLWRWTSPQATAPWPARGLGLGLLGGLLMAGHITNGLLLIPLCFGALWYMAGPDRQNTRARLRAGIAPATLVSLTAFSLIALLYARAYTSNPLASGLGFIDWVIGLANPDTGLGYHKSYWALSLSAIPNGLLGFYRALLAGAPDRFFSSPWLAITRITFSALLLAGLLLYALSLPGLFKKDSRTQVLLLLYLVPLAAFSMIWEPANFEMKVALLPLLWLAIAMSAARLRERAKTAVTVLFIVAAAALFAHNFTSSILPGSRAQNNVNLQRAYFVSEHTEPEAMIHLAGTYSGYNMGKIYLVYFAGRQTNVVDWIPGRGLAFQKQLLGTIHKERGRPLYVLSELIEPGPALNELGKNHELDPRAITRTFEMFSPEPVASMDDGFGIYRISPVP